MILIFFEKRIIVKKKEKQLDVCRLFLSHVRAQQSAVQNTENRKELMEVAKRFQTENNVLHWHEINGFQKENKSFWLRDRPHTGTFHIEPILYWPKKKERNKEEEEKRPKIKYHRNAFALLLFFQMYFYRYEPLIENHGSIGGQILAAIFFFPL